MSAPVPLRLSGRSCGRSRCAQLPRKAGAFFSSTRNSPGRNRARRVTHKALQRYPFLAERGTKAAELNRIRLNKILRLQSARTESCRPLRVDQPCGKRARFRLQHPSQSFRAALNGLLLERARRASADIHKERITRIERADNQNEDDWHLTTPDGDYRASYVILAAGARNPFRQQFLSPILPAI